MSGLDWSPPPAPPLAQIQAEIGTVLAAAEAAVVRWEWQPLASSLESPEPFGRRQIGGDPPKRRPPSWVPRDPTNAVRYGWDAEGRIVLARQYTSYAREVVPERDQILTFAYNAHGDHLTVRHWRWAGAADVRLEVQTVQRRRVEGDRLVELVVWPADGLSEYAWVRKEYTYDVSGRVVESGFQREPRPDDDDNQRAAGRFTAEYDDLGDMTVLRRQELDEHGEPTSPVTLVWERTDAAAVVDAERRIAATLPDAIRAWVARQRPASPAYCLAIVYGDTGPPAPAIGTVGELAEWGPPASEARLDMMWNPAEFALFGTDVEELETPELIEACRIVQQAWGIGSEGRWRAVAVAAAAAIEDDHLSLPRAPAFVTYATDVELADLDANLRKLKRGRARRAAERLPA